MQYSRYCIAHPEFVHLLVLSAKLPLKILLSLVDTSMQIPPNVLLVCKVRLDDTKRMQRSQKVLHLKT